ncbi:MAG: 50S ribosomal protein L5 [Candidatus Anstonellaceae archaeon]
MDKTQNPMRQIVIEKVTLNIGVGQAGVELENAKLLLSRLTSRKPVETLAKVRNPVFHIKKGDPIGTKVTLRNQEAVEFLKKALKVKEFKLSKKNFDKFGNFSFGIPEYIHFPGIKYDPKIGIIGFDVCVSLKRKGGWRTKNKKIKKSKISKKHLITKEEGIEFVKKNFGVEII